MSWLLIILLIIVGLLLLLLEILVIPGITVAGILGFAGIFIGIWQSYSTYGATSGHITLASTILLTILTLYFAFKSGTWKKMELKTKVDGKIDHLEGHSLQIGDIGKSISRLAPSGKVLFNSTSFEVHTYGEFIDPEKEVRIISLIDNKIIVTLNN